MLERQPVLRAFSRAWAKTGNRIAARIAMIAITTRSSINVNPERSTLRSDIAFFSFLDGRPPLHPACPLQSCFPASSRVPAPTSPVREETMVPTKQKSNKGPRAVVNHGSLAVRKPVASIQRFKAHQEGSVGQ